MKKIYLRIIVPILLLCLIGCNKIEESLDSGSNVLNATVESGANTKTEMSPLQDGVYKTMWIEGDEIAVFIDGTSNISRYVLISGEGTPSASFEGYGQGSSYVAFYPLNMAKELKAGSVYVELPSVQIYKEGSYGDNAFPMLAVSNANNLAFKNTCGVVAISMIGNQNVKSITFRANDKNVFVSGLARVDVDSKESPLLIMENAASNEVVLQCNGATLDSKEATEFYLVLPAQTYKGGFTLVIETFVGKIEKSTTKDLVLERSQLRKMKTFACEIEGDFSTGLEGDGTEESPFLIQSVEDLKYMREAVNSAAQIKSKGSQKSVEAQSAHYRLTCDLSLSTVCGEGKGNWTPIGNYSANKDSFFKGVFDGDGHTISDLYINSSKNYQGLFGYMHSYGVLKNLTVKGYVKAQEYVGLLCGGCFVDWYGAYDVSEIINCKAYGKVVSDYGSAAGIIGYGCIVSDCTNFAEVVSDGIYVSGITGCTSYVVYNCINAGNITARGDYVGGIVGYHNHRDIYNCYNIGKIDGNNNVGGIAGLTRYYGVLYNCYNLGEVTGKEYVGGIAGECYDISRKLANCVNLGKITAKANPKTVGSICGYNSGEILNSYWLYEKSANKGYENGVAFTYENGRAENCFSLTELQIKGEENSNNVLYSAQDNIGYSNILDALNGWAFDNKSDEMLLYGWMKGDGDGYPVFTGKAAEKPSGSSTPIFELFENEFNVGYRGGEITVELKATMSYYISSMPEWITEITPEGTNGDGNMKKHIFKVEENPNYEDRQGVIVFCNESQQCIPVTVIQKAKIDQDLSWVDKEFWHKSLVMRFTADWCGYCPMMATAIADAQAQWPNKLEALSLHGSGGLQSNASVQIESMYSITSYPTGIVDGRVKVPNYTNISYTTSQIIAAAKDTEENYETLTGASWNSSISGNRAELNLTAYIKRAGSYKVTALLVEDNIVGNQSGEGNNYNHKDVVRAAFSNATGDAFTVSTDGQVQEFSYTLDLSNAWNRDNLKVVVYIQRKDANGAYFIDNSTSAKLGKEMPLMVISDGVTGGMEGVEPGGDIPYNN